jgi:hypothetical protein
MSKGRHASGRKTPPGFAIRAAGAASASTGIILIPFSLDELFRYSPYGDPGAGTAGLWLAVSALLLIGVPVAVAAVITMVRAGRRYLAWRRSLTPGERAAVSAAEVVFLLGAETALRHYNHEQSARLTASVMGPDRGDAA